MNLSLSSLVQNSFTLKIQSIAKLNIENSLQEKWAMIFERSITNNCLQISVNFERNCYTVRSACVQHDRIYL